MIFGYPDHFMIWIFIFGGIFVRILLCFLEFFSFVHILTILLDRIRCNYKHAWFLSSINYSTSIRWLLSANADIIVKQFFNHKTSTRRAYFKIWTVQTLNYAGLENVFVKKITFCIRHNCMNQCVFAPQNFHDCE